MSGPAAALAAPAEGVVDPADQARDLRVAGVGALGLGLVGSALELGVLCPLRRLTGVPCPLCGLTTGTWALAHGHVAEAVAAHPLAPAAVILLALAWTPWGPGLVAGVRRHPTLIAALLAVVWLARLTDLYGS